MNNEYLKLLKDKKFLESKEFKKLKKDINDFIKNVAYVDDVKDYIVKYVKDCNLFNDMINDLINKKVDNFYEYFKKSPLILYSGANTWSKLLKLFNDLKDIVKKG